MADLLDIDGLIPVIDPVYDPVWPDVHLPQAFVFTLERLTALARGAGERGHDGVQDAFSLNGVDALQVLFNSLMVDDVIRQDASSYPCP